MYWLPYQEGPISWEFIGGYLIGQGQIAYSGIMDIKHEDGGMQDMLFNLHHSRLVGSLTATPED